MFIFLFKYYKARKNVRNLKVNTSDENDLFKNLSIKREKFKNC